MKTLQLTSLSGAKLKAFPQKITRQGRMTSPFQRITGDPRQSRQLLQNTDMDVKSKLQYDPESHFQVHIPEEKQGVEDICISAFSAALNHCNSQGTEAT